MAGTVQVELDELLAQFQTLEDPRSEINRRHPLPSVLMIALMAVLAGAGGPTAIARWATMKHDWLKTLLPLPNGIPSRDVFRRVLMAVDPQAFQACFADWLAALREQAEETLEEQRTLLAIDGKTLRRSHDRQAGLGPLHSVSVWASELGLTLAQVACEEKSNEITAIPEVLKRVSLPGAIVTIDAMGTQTEIARQIVEGGADYLLCLKGNQETIHQAVMEHVNAQLDSDFQHVRHRRHITRETGHGRVELRHYIQLPVPKDLAGKDRWAGLKTIGVAMLTCERNGKETYETLYYLSSLPLGVKLFARAARSHWGIENGCHWVLDVTYREDDSRIREEFVRENFAWLNRFTLSLLKQHPGKGSIAMKRRSCGWSDAFLLQVLTTSVT